LSINDLNFNVVQNIFSAQQHICRARYVLSPIHLYVRLSHGWISQTWLELG